MGGVLDATAASLGTSTRSPSSARPTVDSRADSSVGGFGSTLAVESVTTPDRLASTLTSTRHAAPPAKALQRATAPFHERVDEPRNRPGRSPSSPKIPTHGVE